MKSIPASLRSLTELRRTLLRHYDRRRRDLPWRGESDPYRILVAEVMLQQTRVETVVKYYEPWLERFPSLKSLAEAGEDEVLKAWEGLGYYRRARNLQRAAEVVVEHPSGFPSSYAELRQLPGVGEYTAGAVASIAFREPVPAVDGNARRVLARLFDVADPEPEWLRRAAADVLDPARPGDWNQALMDLGATVCVPRHPTCEECPLAGWCSARAAGTERERPAPRSRRQVRKATIALAVLHENGRAMLVRRPIDGLLGGLWAFPEQEVRSVEEAEAATLAIAEGMGAAVVGAPEAMPRREHRFTHVWASYIPYALRVIATDVPREATWVDARTPSELALPVAQRGVLNDFRDRRTWSALTR